MPLLNTSQVITVTIASGGSLSSEIDLSIMGGVTLTGINMPATWTTATLTFAASDVSGGTFNPICDDTGAEYNPAAAAARYIAIDATLFVGVRYLKVRSGTSGTPVNQGGDRSLKLVTLKL